MGSANLKVKGIYKNGNNFTAKVRIPIDLKKHYPKGKKHLQKPLGTDDYIEAIKKATPILEQWDKEFKDLRAGKQPSVEALKAFPIGKDISNAIGIEDLEFDAIDDRLIKEAERRAKVSTKKNGKSLTQDQFHRLAETIYGEGIDLEDVLNPAEMLLLKSKGHIKLDIKLSDALTIYLETHHNGGKKTIKDMANYSIDGLIASQGDLVLADPQKNKEGALSRQHLEAWLKEMVEIDGLKTGTAKRRLNQVKAILRQVFVVRQISNVAFLVDRLVVPNSGRDAKDIHSPPPHELKAILESFKDDPLITLLVFLGCRIAEVSGLKISDLHLTERLAYISIRPNEIRGLKTAQSARDVPVFGKSLEALEAIKMKYSNETYLLPQYAKQRGANNASQTLNKRLTTKGFTLVNTHSFRHALKDLLRNSGCPDSLAEDIQGRGRDSIARGYGKGYSLDRKAEALQAAYALIKVN